ncbi:hypothetical protein Ptr902_04648 [Pyrenophora tritici-repentis]|uniref:Uncharacterized protein n=1 Tax=Pyrenophora tritici-repentis TaxID=45151 RepID=A0A922NAB3_9PLEO|nr:hypothetical protein Ptr86124_010346 [Pyrenophora tritici-repentis]KAI1669922.1 hypothetical protein L13192_05438 [Pyrenophora tritici-repentis]KAI1681515.1 hypothetical protein KJE20_08386 [Pyrenophora tritici-repentis]KAI2485708.1 hypothetical protein Ptr902_04648 [Pyrenophora tritici-repentis]
MATATAMAEKIIIQIDTDETNDASLLLLGATLVATLDCPEAVAVHCSPQAYPFGQQLPPRSAAQLYQALGQLPPAAGVTLATPKPVGATTTTPLVLRMVSKPVGHTLPLEAEAASVVVAEPLVGRTGASGARVLVGPPRHDAPVAQVRPFAQHPPPKDTGHENHPVEHVYAEVDIGSGVVEGDVGTTTTAVEVGAELEVGG